MRHSKSKYFNFPIQLLKGMLLNKQRTLEDIFDYSVYARSLKFYYSNSDEKFTKALEYYGVTVENKAESRKNGRGLMNNTYPGSSPMTGMSVHMYFDFYENDKSEFEIVCLLAFLSLKSIVGNKRYAKTNNLFLLSRMDGNTKAVKSPEDLSPEIREYNTHYRMRKIKDTLDNNWGLKTYSNHMRGFYFSFEISPADLVYEALIRTDRIKKEMQKLANKEATEEALNRIFENKK